MPKTSMHLTREEKKAFGEGLREARERCGLTAGELAQKINVGLSAVVQWEAGIHAPSLENAILLTRVLGLSLPELLTPVNVQEAERFLQKQRSFRAMREAAGLTTEEASKLAGLSPACINYARIAEEGRSRLTVFEEATLVDVYQTAIEKKQQEAQSSRWDAKRIGPTLKPEFAPKHEEPDKPEAIITMIPRDDMLSFQQFISRKLVAAARNSSDESVRKLADVLALIDEYEGERSGERRNESQVA